MALGDDEHPISFLFEYEELGEHVHVQVRAGIAGSRAVCGRLVMRTVEWVAFQRMIREGSRQFTRRVLQHDVGRDRDDEIVVHVDWPRAVQFLAMEGMVEFLGAEDAS